jgi:hypothetical protein
MYLRVDFADKTMAEAGLATIVEGLKELADVEDVEGRIADERLSTDQITDALVSVNLIVATSVVTVHQARSLLRALIGLKRDAKAVAADIELEEGDVPLEQASGEAILAEVD